MGRRITSRILVSGAFLFLVMIGVDVTAQTAPMAPHAATTTTGPQTQPPKGAQNHSAAEQNPACQKILNECKKLGFIDGQYKKDNGLWKDCFDPVVKGGGSPTREGRPISVPVSSSDVQSCRASVGHHKPAQ
jgi:hypothetical protein